MHNVVFYIVTFFMVYEAIALPVLLRSLFAKDLLLLSNARYVGGFLPDIVITGSAVQVVFVCVALALYLPSLLLVDVLAHGVARIADKFWFVDALIWRRIKVLLFCPVALAISIGSTWLFYPLTLATAAVNTLVFFLLIMMVLLGPRG